LPSAELPNFKDNTRALIIGLGGSANNVLASLKENCNVFYRSMNVGAYDMNPVGNTFCCIPDRWPYFYQMLSFPEHFEEDLKDFIKEEINQSKIDIVFVVSGLGNNGTGTLLTKTVLSLVKELGFPCISVVSLPFLFQGNKTLASSLETFREIQKVAGLMICFPLEEIVKDNKGYTVLDAFKIADLWMSGTIKAVITGEKDHTTRKILSKIVESYESSIPYSDKQENAQELEILRKSYCRAIVWYSLTFRDRIDIALGTMTYPQIGVHDEVKKMSEQELYRRYNSIKKPWWNCIAKWIEDKLEENSPFIYKFLLFYRKHM
jgi:hypothetical protein